MIRLVGTIASLLFAASIQAQDVLGDLRGQGSGYARVVPGKTLEFPRDHGAHSGFRTEWWYLTGILKDDPGNRYGFQITFFQRHGHTLGSGT